ncbi:hypothetical protein Brsp01_23420 [Brucella sp. NBRC 12950]|nr:hypothetical protein Brsp01_23420 [Brucella sp. NBRC 12950]
MSHDRVWSEAPHRPSWFVEEGLSVLVIVNHSFATLKDIGDYAGKYISYSRRVSFLRQAQHNV